MSFRDSFGIWLLVDNLTPCPSPARNTGKTTDIDSWRGEYRREGAKPPLKFYPLLNIIKCEHR
jgi:hypothetical protein